MRRSKGRKVALASAIALLLLIPIGLWTAWPRAPVLPDFESLGQNEQGYAEYRDRRTGIVFVSLPGGTFLMGSPESEEGHQENEGPVHEVTLSPFMIAKHEVTQKQWTDVMGPSPIGFRFPGDDKPAEQISWDEIQGFESATGLGLPTEAQWEYACRAGTTGPYAGTGKLDDMGWYYDNHGGGSHPVGQKHPNHFGLYDMHGNVNEWCEDVYDANFYSSPGAGGPDPVSTAGSGHRVVRGCGWLSTPPRCRSAFRFHGRPGGRTINLGFRPAVPTP